MKKVVMMIVGAGLLMSSCGSYTATGAKIRWPVRHLNASGNIGKEGRARGGTARLE